MSRRDLDDDVALTPESKQDEPDFTGEEHTASRSAQIFVDLAKTGRSTCRVCDEQIALNTPRCGQDRFGNGVTKTGYVHALCFFREMSCDYNPAQRGRCQASGTPFGRGDLRIKFDAIKTTYWLPQEAGRFTSKIVALILESTPAQHDEAVACLHAIPGMEMLESHHQDIVLKFLLSGGTAPGETLRSTCQTPAKAALGPRRKRELATPPAVKGPNLGIALNDAFKKLSQAKDSGGQADHVEESVQKRARFPAFSKLVRNHCVLDLD